jgi:hypothetical protein
LAIGNEIPHHMLQSTNKNFCQNLIKTIHRADRSEIPNLKLSSLLWDESDKSSIKTLLKPLMPMKVMKDTQNISLNYRPTGTIKSNREAIGAWSFVFIHAEQSLENLLLLERSLKPTHI